MALRNRERPIERSQDVRRLNRRHPDGRHGGVEEIASVVFFPAGRGASLMTGSVVVVDGGYTCW